MALLTEIKLALRIKSDDFDAEITDLIEMAKKDLSIAGVIQIVETDPLVKQAVKLYCKGNFGYDENSERFQLSYLNLKQSMSLCGDYQATEVV